MPALVKDECAPEAQYGLLATPTTIRSGLYHQLLVKQKPLLILDTDGQEQTEHLIRRTIAGELTNQDDLSPLIVQLQAKGATKVILGCTELSVLHTKPDPRCIDPLQLLATELFTAHTTYNQTVNDTHLRYNKD